MDTYYLRSQDLPKFYEHIAQRFKLYVPTRIKTPLKLKCDSGTNLPTDDYLLKEYSQVNKEEIVFNEYRCVEPLRSFFVRFKEEVCDYFSEGKETEVKESPIAIVGVKNCDLYSLKIQDYVFLEGSGEDPVYKTRRESALIISGDCPNCKEACFCRAFDINPHATEGFDFNFSPLNDGYLVDVGSKRAEEITAAIKEIFTPATVGQLSGRDAKRESMLKRIDKHLSFHQIPKKETLRDIVISGLHSGIWKEQMETCVECGGCVFMCDTCHCFLLTDEASKDNAKRMRVWDGCLFGNFSRVAGGANPLRSRFMRLRNRYLKKFDFFIENMGIPACCGCGRCIEVCPGRIDIRHILKRLHDEKYLSTR